MTLEREAIASAIWGAEGHEAERIDITWRYLIEVEKPKRTIRRTLAKVNYHQVHQNGTHSNRVALVVREDDGSIEAFVQAR